MTDDATLSDFAIGGADESEVTDDDSSPSSDGGDRESVDGDSSPPSDGREPDSVDDDSSPPEPASESSTYAWGEYTCTSCETATDRVWRDDGRFVCPDCKPW